MVSTLDNLLGDMKGKYKSLRKKYVSLQESYEELKTSHEIFLDTHEKLKEAHKSHISHEANKVKVYVGITNCHMGENTYNKMWECQRFTLRHEGLGYIAKKNKIAFIDKKTTFMKECGLYCSKCKNTGHLDKDCTGSKIMYASIDPSYVLVKSSKGDVYAKFVGKKNHAHISNNGIGTKRKSILVSKALVTNLQGPK
jgi:hypothetical protein